MSFAEKVINILYFSLRICKHPDKYRDQSHTSQRKDQSIVKALAKSTQRRISNFFCLSKKDKTRQHTYSTTIHLMATDAHHLVLILLLPSRHVFTIWMRSDLSRMFSP